MVGQTCTGGSCVTSGTAAVECPSGCECLTEERAAEVFGGSYSRCSEVQKPCGIETQTKPSSLSAPSVVSKYCFKRYADCPDSCGCLLPSEASAEDFTLCGGVRTVCGGQWVGGGIPASVKSDFLEKYCYLLRSPEPCPASCSCLDPAKAAGMGYPSCGEEQVPCDADSQGRPYYCYQPVSGTPVSEKLVSGKPVACAKGCSCLEPVKAVAAGYTYCDGKKTLCGYDEDKNQLYCYRKPETAAESQLPAEGEATPGLISGPKKEKMVIPLPRAKDCWLCRMLDVGQISSTGGTGPEDRHPVCPG